MGMIKGNPAAVTSGLKLSGSEAFQAARSRALKAR